MLDLDVVLALGLGPAALALILGPALSAGLTGLALTLGTGPGTGLALALVTSLIVSGVLALGGLIPNVRG